MNTALYLSDQQASQARFAVGFSDSATDETLVAWIVQAWSTDSEPEYAVS